MVKSKTVTAIILSAGNSTRFGKNRNKNFEMINEKAVLQYSIEAFNKNINVDNIIIASKENEKNNVENIIKKLAISKDISVVIGGNTRKESVYNCLKCTNSDIVIIHDGARPLIKQEYINKCIENVESYLGVAIGVKSKDTIKVTDENGVVINSTKRDNTWLSQTPQSFDRNILLELHEKYKNSDFTDDCMLLEKENIKVKMLEGDYSNIKITTFDDLDIVKMYLTKT